MPINIRRSLREAVTSQGQRLHATIREGLSQRIKDNVVSDGLIKLMFRRPNQGSGSLIQKLPFGIVRLFLVEDDGTLKPFEELGGRTSPVT